MIDKTICEAIGLQGYQCGLELMKQQLASILIVIFVPFMLISLLYLATSKFKKNALVYVLLVIGFPLTIAILLIFMFPYLINLM